jgi:hypothetical protein
MIDIVVIGAGPYGLSIGAYLHRQGISFRMFGKPMDSWLNHMPKGMYLKSDGFASNIYDPHAEFTLQDYCAQTGIKYADRECPVQLDTFSQYGLAFQKKMVPELEDKIVAQVDRVANGFRVELSDGETLSTKSVILAIGITHFQYVPQNLAHLPPESLSHSFHHHRLEAFRGRSVTVIGAGSSATDLAGLLYDIGAEVHLVSRSRELKFHNKPTGKPRSLWQRMVNPGSGLGPGYRSRFFADAPMIFHYLPKPLRIEAVRRALGPSGGWFAKDKVVGRVGMHLGCTPVGASLASHKIHLEMSTSEGTNQQIETDHIIAATGYRVDLNRLTFLSADIRSSIEQVNSTPVLSTAFESSIPQLYFSGITAANSFGPVMRFAFGAQFTARRLTGKVVKSVSRGRAAVAMPEVSMAAK